MLPLFFLLFLMLGMLLVIIWINVCCFLSNTDSYKTKWFATCQFFFAGEMIKSWFSNGNDKLMIVIQWIIRRNFIEYILNMGFGFLCMCIYVVVIPRVDGNGIIVFDWIISCFLKERIISIRLLDEFINAKIKISTLTTSISNYYLIIWGTHQVIIYTHTRFHATSASPIKIIQPTLDFKRGNK